MGKVIKNFFIVFILLINVMVIGRVILSTDKSAFKDLTLTKDIALEYEKDGSVQILTHKVEGGLSEEGLFCAYSMYYIPGAREFQITIRYNKSAYKFTETDTDREFDFRLYDPETEQYFDAKPVDETKHLMYTFKKYVFSEAELDTDRSFNIVMSLDGGVLDEQVVHYKEQEFKEYELSKSEIAELDDMADDLR